jgi:hypothetical protein
LVNHTTKQNNEQGKKGSCYHLKRI